MKRFFLTSLFLALFSFILAQSTVYNVLVVDEVTGFNHNTGPATEQLINRIKTTINSGNPSATIGNVVRESNTGSFITLALLSQYQIVVLANTSGDNTWSPVERATFEIWAQNGGHILAYHAASDAYRHPDSDGCPSNIWPFYSEGLIGYSDHCSPNHTPGNNVQATLTTNANAPSTLTNNLPASQTFNGEWYYQGYKSPDFEEFLRVGSTGGSAKDTARSIGIYRENTNHGRSVYIAMGHHQWQYSDPYFEQLSENVIRWFLDTQSLGITYPPDEQLASVKPYVGCPVDASLVIGGSFIEEGINEIEVTIVNSFGTVVYSTNVSSPSTNNPIEMPFDFAAGIYAVLVTDPKKGYTYYSDKIIRR